MKAVPGRQLKKNIPSQIYNDSWGRSHKFLPGEFVPMDLIKKFNINPAYFIHPSSLYNQGAFEFAHKHKKKFSVAIIRDMNGMGDVLMASVIAKALRYEYKDDINIWFVVKPGYERVLQGNPFVDKIYTDKHELEKNIPDIRLDVNNLEFRVELKDFERDGVVAKNRTSIYLEHMQLFLENKTPVYIVTEEERAWAKAWLKENNYSSKKVLIGIQLNGSNITRTYPHMLEVIDLFPDKDFQFVILDKSLAWSGNPQAAEYMFDIGHLGAIVEQCDVIVSQNSYILHLAGALKKRIVSVFGSTDSKVWLEDYEKAVSVEIDCPEGKRNKCWWSLDCLPGETMREKEETNTPRCLTEVSPDLVKEKIEEQFIKPKKVLVVILTYNYLELTKQCIDSVRSFHDYDIFVIDNESTDGTQEWLKEQGIDYISKALSVPNAWNKGLKKGWKEGYDYVLLCNNDIILSPTYIDKVVEVIERRKCACVTGRVINKSEANQTKFHDLTKNIELPVHIMEAGDYSAILLSIDCIKNAGKFRNLAPRYQSDEDHLLRMRLMNMDLIKTYATTFFHKHGAVFKGMSTQMQDLEWKKGVEAFKKIWNIDPYAERSQLNSLQNVKKLNPDWEEKLKESW